MRIATMLRRTFKPMTIGLAILLAGPGVAAAEGIELNVAGPTFGVDPPGLGLQLPGIGRIGPGENPARKP